MWTVPQDLIPVIRGLWCMYCSAQDFAVGLATLLHGSPEERLRWTFDLYDVDKVVVCTVYCSSLYCSGGRTGWWAGPSCGRWPRRWVQRRTLGRDEARCRWGRYHQRLYYLLCLTEPQFGNLIISCKLLQIMIGRSTTHSHTGFQGFIHPKQVLYKSRHRMPVTLV